jgi:MFS family permease
MSADTASARVSSGMLRPQPAPGINFKLSIMMFLQYAIWGAWLPLMFPYFTEFRGFTAQQISIIAAIGAAGALVAPFIAGQIADRYFNSEKFLGVSHILGAVLIWVMAYTTKEQLVLLSGLSFLYALLYTPTLALTNSLAFFHLPDRDRDFGKVRVWGTIGWIAVGIGIGQWLLYKAGTDRPLQVKYMADAFRVSGVLGFILGIYCFFLPKTPPQRARVATVPPAPDVVDAEQFESGGRQPSREFAPFEALGEIFTIRALLVMFLVAFPVSCIHQFYFVRTAGFLGSPQLGLNNAAATINKIFGVGGGGLMTIGQMSEIIVLALMPLVAKSLSRKSLLSIGLLAYILRFFIFAYVHQPWAVVAALALHGICFGCFFFVCFMIVDEMTTKDVRASAQNLFNLIIVGFGVIVGNLFAGQVDKWAMRGGVIDWGIFFSIPMWIAVGCLGVLVLFYPSRSRTIDQGRLAAV